MLTLDRLDILQDVLGIPDAVGTLAIAGLIAGAVIVVPLLQADKALRRQTLPAPAAIVSFGCLAWATSLPKSG